jgi:hypothetical protein
LLKLKDKVLSDLEEVSMEIGYDSISFEYLEKYTKEVPRKVPKAYHGTKTNAQETRRK